MGKVAVVKHMRGMAMDVNNGGNLSRLYEFSHESEDALLSVQKKDILEKFFKGNSHHFVPVSYQSFTQTLDEIEIN